MTFVPNFTSHFNLIFTLVRLVSIDNLANFERSNLVMTMIIILQIYLLTIPNVHTSDFVLYAIDLMLSGAIQRIGPIFEFV